MSELHIYTAGWYPMTKLPIDPDAARKSYVKCSPFVLTYCDTCGKRRRAGNVMAKVYYDCIYRECRWCRRAKEGG